MDLYYFAYISICVHKNVTYLAIVFWFSKDTEIREEIIKFAIRKGTVTGRDRLIIIFS
jgi:hypothetical protein